jgi:hypothetical protein
MPTTVVQWHRQRFRLFWRWRSRSGRPSVKREIRDLIRQMSSANPVWGAPRSMASCSSPASRSAKLPSRSTWCEEGNTFSELEDQALALLLLCNGYDPNLEPDSPLDLAFRIRRWDLLDLLLEWGADPRRLVSVICSTPTILVYTNDFVTWASI